jgi:pimeloyl-ACP methyl ester carboxylesterase
MSTITHHKGGRASRTSDRHRFAERQCLRRRAQRRLDSDSRVLERAEPSQSRWPSSLLKPETTVWQYTEGAPDKALVSPDGYSLDNFYLARPGADEVQLDLFLDYASNVAMYPAFQRYFRESQPLLLAVWGRNDPFFLPAGAEAFKRDIPNAECHLLDAGHFAIETHYEAIASAITAFFSRKPSAIA